MGGGPIFNPFQCPLPVFLPLSVPFDPARLLLPFPGVFESSGHDSGFCVLSFCGKGNSVAHPSVLVGIDSLLSGHLCPSNLLTRVENRFKRCSCGACFALQLCVQRTD